MLAASIAVQRPPNAKLLVVDSCGNISHRARFEFVDLLCPGDLVIANDAATLPASLSGHHVPSGESVEVRLAGRTSLAMEDIRHFFAVIFGPGDYRIRTEDRPKPPALSVGDQLLLGPLRATVTAVSDSPRFISLEFHGDSHEIWEGLARHGRPIQYSHLSAPLAVWDSWTAIAGPPVAFEPPSAGFILDWRILKDMSDRRVRFETITHAAGISSTGDKELDALLPLDEPYRIPLPTAQAIEQAQAYGNRIIAVGTTVVRALENSAALFDGEVQPGEYVATQRIGQFTELRIVNAIVSGTHEPGSSHHELIRAFVANDTLARIDLELNSQGYRTHEFGDSVFLEKADRAYKSQLRSLFLSGSLQFSSRSIENGDEGSCLDVGKSKCSSACTER